MIDRPATVVQVAPASRLAHHDEEKKVTRLTAKPLSVGFGFDFVHYAPLEILI